MILMDLMDWKGHIVPSRVNKSRGTFYIYPSEISEHQTWKENQERL